MLPGQARLDHLEFALQQYLTQNNGYKKSYLFEKTNSWIE